MLLIAGILALVMTGCGNSDGGDPETKAQDYAVKLYFASATYVTEGVDDVNGELMPPVDTTVTCNEGEQYLETLKLLSSPPDDTYSTMISDKITFNSVELKDDGIAYVDVSSENLNGGSLAEIIFVDQILYTLINSFDEIDSVQFTLDGAVADSLMGHLETGIPLTVDGDDK